MIPTLLPKLRMIALRVALFVTVSVFVGLVAWSNPATANDIKAQFPSTYGGTLWMSSRFGYQGYVYVVSSNCTQVELDTYAEIKSSTTGKPEMSNWANGIQMSRYKCDNVWDYTADLRISYMDQSNFLQSNGSYIGGRNVDVQASADYCATWGTSYPCGSRPNVPDQPAEVFR